MYYKHKKYGQMQRQGLTSEDIYYAIKNDLGPKYYLMKQQGCKPEAVFLAIKADLGTTIGAIRLFREIFNLSFDDAKRIIFKAENDGRETLLEETQQSIIKLLESKELDDL